ncbi:MAG: MMPL family transporter [Actinomycetota bacterium]
MSWEKLAQLVLRAPGRLLAASLVILAIPSVGLLDFRTDYDQVGQLPDESDSVRGFEALSGSFGPGQVQPVIVMARARKTVWTDEAFAAIDLLTLNLEKVPGVAQVRSVTRPTTGGVTQEQLQDIGLGDVGELTEGLPRATEGLGRATDGLSLIREGLKQIRASVPEQRANLEAAQRGVALMRDGLARIIPGIERIIDGIREGSSGLRRLADEAAEPALRAVEAAWMDLKQTGTLARTDPEYADLAKHVGEALGTLTGRCPDATGIGPQPPDCPAGKKIDPEYDGLAPALREVATGADDAAHGLGRIHDGLEEIDDGLARFEDGFRQQPAQLERLETGVTVMIGGLDRIIPGLERLKRGLAAGAALLEETGLIPEPTGDVAVTASLAKAFPKLREQLEFFVGDRDRATRLFVILDQQPYATRSLHAADRIRDIAELSLRETPLLADRVRVTGASPFFADISRVTARDTSVIVLAVTFGVFLVLVLLLRSLVGPFYLVLTVLLSFAATLGLTSFVFQGLLGEHGLVWWLPLFLFVTLVALGADYNIFLMGRIREEAHKGDTRHAVATGLAATGHVITSAGLILAGTFAALLAAPFEGMVQLGFSATMGLLIDTFIVRSLLVPSIAVLAGSASWWPSARSKQP